MLVYTQTISGVNHKKLVTNTCLKPQLSHLIAVWPNKQSPWAIYKIREVKTVNICEISIIYYWLTKIMAAIIIMKE